MLPSKWSYRRQPPWLRRRTATATVGEGFKPTRCGGDCRLQRIASRRQTEPAKIKKPPPLRDESCVASRGTTPAFPAVPSGRRGTRFARRRSARPGRPANGGRVRRRLPPRHWQDNPVPCGAGIGPRLGSDVRRRAPRPLSPQAPISGPVRTRCAPASRLLVSVFAFVQCVGRHPLARRLAKLEDRAGLARMSIEATLEGASRVAAGRLLCYAASPTGLQAMVGMYQRS